MPAFCRQMHEYSRRHSPMWKLIDFGIVVESGKKHWRIGFPQKNLIHSSKNKDLSWEWTLLTFFRIILAFSWRNNSYQKSEDLRQSEEQVVSGFAGDRLHEAFGYVQNAQWNFRAEGGLQVDFISKYEYIRRTSQWITTVDRSRCKSDFPPIPPSDLLFTFLFLHIFAQTFLFNEFSDLKFSNY